MLPYLNSSTLIPILAGLSIIIGFCKIKILSILLLPEDMGYYGLFTNTVALYSALINFGYATLLTKVLPKDINTAVRNSIAVTTSLFIIVIPLALLNFITMEIILVLFMLPTIMLTNFTQILYALYLRHYGGVAVQMAQVLSNSFILLCLTAVYFFKADTHTNVITICVVVMPLIILLITYLKGLDKHYNLLALLKAGIADISLKKLFTRLSNYSLQNYTILTSVVSALLHLLILRYLIALHDDYELLGILQIMLMIFGAGSGIVNAYTSTQYYVDLAKTDNTNMDIVVLRQFKYQTLYVIPILVVSYFIFKFQNMILAETYVIPGSIFLVFCLGEILKMYMLIYSYANLVAKLYIGHLLIDLYALVGACILAFILNYMFGTPLYWSLAITPGIGVLSHYTLFKHIGRRNVPTL